MNSKLTIEGQKELAEFAAIMGRNGLSDVISGLISVESFLRRELELLQSTTKGSNCVSVLLRGHAPKVGYDYKRDGHFMNPEPEVAPSENELHL
jgi:hypothetical protein